MCPVHNASSYGAKIWYKLLISALPQLAYWDFLTSIHIGNMYMLICMWTAWPCVNIIYQPMPYKYHSRGPIGRKHNFACSCLTWYATGFSVAIWFHCALNDSEKQQITTEMLSTVRVPVLSLCKGRMYVIPVSTPTSISLTSVILPRLAYMPSHADGPRAAWASWWGSGMKSPCGTCTTAPLTSAMFLKSSWASIWMTLTCMRDTSLIFHYPNCAGFCRVCKSATAHILLGIWLEHPYPQ